MSIAEHVWRVLGEGGTVERDAVAEVLATAEAAKDVAWHPTGFVVGKLSVTERGVLRLHVWPDDERIYGEPHWPVHDHVFSLQSLVLVGAVVSREHEVADDRAGSMRRWAVDYGPGRASQLVPDGEPVVMQPAEPITTHAGETYAVDAGRFHASTVPEGQLAATLVATRGTERQRPFVLGPAQRHEPIAVRRIAVAPERWRGWVHRIAEAWTRS